MAADSPDHPDLVLTPGAQLLVEAALANRVEGHAALGVHHWLLALVTRHGPMAESIVPTLAAASLRQNLTAKLGQGDVGSPLERETVVSAALERARGRGKPQAAERDLAAVILKAAGYDVASEPGAGEPRPPGSEPSGPAGAARPLRPTPMLDQYGRDLTRLARENRLGPVIGRQDEIELTIETLCRRTKRNPALVGPAGVGKTAIVEGLAQRLVSGAVPKVLHGIRLVELSSSSLVAGARVVGELEERMKQIITEASQDGIVLFIDELHSIMGAGGMPGVSDVSSQLKPALARGDLACIAATTDEEYRRFVEPDKAMERRFQPIRVSELTPDQTLEVTGALAEMMKKTRGIEVPAEVQRWMVSFAGRYLKNRHFPDKAVDLLEQCVAHALTQDRKLVTIEDAEQVSQRLIGMPADFSERHQALREQLGEGALLAADEAAALLARLEVTMRGLDVRPGRPNAVVMMTGEAESRTQALAQCLAETLFGAGGRVVSIDFSRFTHPADVTQLLGAPPGYVGYSETLPIHQVAAMPWCVLCCEGLHACHPQILEVLTRALENGYFTEARGRRIYLSDSVVVLSAALELAPEAHIGFRAQASAGDGAEAGVRALLGARLIDQCDLICHEAVDAPGAHGRWLEHNVLADLAERYRQEGVHLQWDRSVIDWLLTQHPADANPRDWERVVDRLLSPALVHEVAVGRGQGERALLVKCREGMVEIEPQPPAGGRA